MNKPYVTVTVHKAQPTVGEVSNLEIRATEPTPEMTGPGCLADARLFYETEGKLLADALQACLPGGTVDALLRELLVRKASLLRVPIEIEVEAPVTTEEMP